MFSISSKSGRRPTEWSRDAAERYAGKHDSCFCQSFYHDHSFFKRLSSEVFTAGALKVFMVRVTFH